MAKVGAPASIRRLLDALKSDLADVGIPAAVHAEPIRGTKLHRVYAVAEKFEALQPSERQDIVWRIAEKTLSTDEQMKISMILTLTPEEMGWVKERQS